MSFLEVLAGIFIPSLKKCWKCGFKWEANGWNDMPDDDPTDYCPKCKTKN